LRCKFSFCLSRKRFEFDCAAGFGGGAGGVEDCTTIIVVLRWKSCELHGFWVPLDDGAFFEAQVAEECGPGCSEAEGGVFYGLLARTDGSEEVAEVIVAVGVTLGCGERFDCIVRHSGGRGGGIFLTVLLDGFLLYLVAEGADGVAGFSFARGARNGDSLAGYLHGAFGAGEEEALALVATVDEVDAEREVEAFWVVEEGEQDVGGVTAVFPEAEVSGGHGASWAVGAGNKVSSTEKVDEEVAGDSAAVVMPFAPLEEALGVPRDLRSGAEEARPVARLGGGIGGNGVVPRTEGGVTVPAGGDHVEFADGSRGEEFLDLGVYDGADALAADLEDAVGGAGS